MPPGPISASWDVELTVRYRRPLPSDPDLPDLDQVVTQPEGKLCKDDTLVERLPVQTLQFGRELVVRSSSTLGRPRPSVLFVTPP
ncbi:MAG: hypothetical protein IT305_13095 [Chloroflexi bacterium]|nr:hypothetical protein [Chloroflexota bacterium]